MKAIALGCVGVSVGSLAVIHLDGHEYPHLSAVNADERQAVCIITLALLHMYYFVHVYQG